MMNFTEYYTRTIDPKYLSEYGKYLKSHKDNVVNAYVLLEKIMPEIFNDINKYEFEKMISKHDSSKFSEEEYKAYEDYFYGNEKPTSDETKKAFNYAWLHHIHHNPHHWQYWVLNNDSGKEECLEMPKKYIIEMLCDWLSFSLRKGDINELFKFYEKNRLNMKLNDKTRRIVENYLNRIKETYKEIVRK
ncbi:hypothetical protein J6W34_09270 [bacterium]|nr:hypothetical protein [bacterium]